MTACMYLSPPWDTDDLNGAVLPVLLADTMVTLEGFEQEEPLIPIQGLGPKTAYSTKLTRKINIVKGCGVALSGKGAPIRDTIWHIKENIDQWMTLDRPMRPLSGYLSEYNRQKGALVVEGTAACQRDDMVYFAAPNRNRKTLRHFGLTISHGSGADELFALVADFDKILDHWDLKEIDAYGKVNALVNNINAIKLIRELRSGAKTGWGGFVEWAFMVPGEQNWCFGPSVLHVFLPNEAYGRGNDPALREARFLAYDPSLCGGSMITASSGDLTFFAIPPILGLFELEAGAFQQWIGWKPEFIVVTIINPVSHPQALFSKTLNPPEREFVHFEITENSTHFATNIPDNWVQSFKRIDPSDLRETNT